MKPEEPLKPEFKSGKGEQKLHSSKEIIYQGPKSAEALEKERPRYTHSHVCSLALSSNSFLSSTLNPASQQKQNIISLQLFKNLKSSVFYLIRMCPGVMVFLRSTSISRSLSGCLLNAESVCGFFFLSKECNIVVYLLPLSSDELKSKLKVKVSPSLAQILEKMELSEREKQEKIGELMSLITPCAC